MTRNPAESNAIREKAAAICAKAGTQAEARAAWIEVSDEIMAVADASDSPDRGYHMRASMDRARLAMLSAIVDGATIQDAATAARSTFTAPAR